MNCKPGDLAAIVFHRHAPLIGAIVHCVKLHGSTRTDVDGSIFAFDDGPRWVINNPLMTSGVISGKPYKTFSIADKNLRPIRGGESPEQSIEAMRNLMQTKTKKEKETT